MVKLKKPHKILLSAAIVFSSLIIAFSAFTTIRAIQFSKTTSAQKLTNQELISLTNYLNSTYKERNQILHSLPYDFTGQSPEIYAESAILIDTASGEIIYEKNADEVIPPASMTKLFAMYVVDQEVAAGRLSYDDIIALPAESWACNMPPHSSLMFLGQGQIVSLEELLLGLSICSGNDAAYALAYTVSGSMEEFIKRMNQVASDNGLTHTHFVESSGYSEENTTTAREMAAFSKIYLTEHPESLKKFHSVPEFTYPKEKNMAPGDVYGPQDFSNGFPSHITMGITQKNTNPLLDILEGCDGLKTGYIDESGYNLALTVQRDGTRFLSVTMKGPGTNTKEGQAGRIHDGKELMEFAFSNFQNYKDLSAIKPYFVKIYGAKEKALNLIPAYTPKSICIPTGGLSAKENAQNLHFEIILPDRLTKEVSQGSQYGEIQILYQSYLLNTIPLLADRSIQQSNFIVRLADFFIH